MRSFETLNSVFLNGCSEMCHFKPGRETVAPKKQTRLPLGLRTKEKKPRKRKARNKSTQTQTAKKSLKMSGLDSSVAMSAKELDLLASGRTLHADVPALAEYDDGCGASSGSESSSSSSSTSEASAALLSGSDSNTSQELTEKVHQEPEAAKEASETRRVYKSHKSLMQRRGEIFGEKAPESEQEVAKVPEPPQQARESGKTQCNSRLGLVASGVQKHQRLAKCRHCNELIQRETARFQFAYSKLKFAAWLHPRCTAAHVQQETSKPRAGTTLDDALEFLRREKAKDGLPQTVRDAIEVVENDFKRL